MVQVIETRVFDVDELAGRTRLFHYDHSDESFTIETKQDVTDLVEANKAISNEIGSGWKGDLHRVASIPMNLYFELKAKGVFDDQKSIRKWLNERDNQVFRTRPGRI